MLQLLLVLMMLLHLLHPLSWNACGRAPLGSELLAGKVMVAGGSCNSNQHVVLLVKRLGLESLLLLLAGQQQQARKGTWHRKSLQHRNCKEPHAAKVELSQ